MPHQTRLVELLIASPEVSVITFSPKPLKVTNSSNSSSIRESAGIVLSCFIAPEGGDGGWCYSSGILLENHSVLNRPRLCGISDGAFMQKDAPPNETKMLRRLAEQLFSQTRKHSSLFSPSVCRYAWKHCRAGSYHTRPENHANDFEKV